MAGAQGAVEEEGRPRPGSNGSLGRGALCVRLSRTSSTDPPPLPRPPLVTRSARPPTWTPSPLPLRDRVVWVRGGGTDGEGDIERGGGEAEAHSLASEPEFTLISTATVRLRLPLPRPPVRPPLFPTVPRVCVEVGDRGEEGPSMLVSSESTLWIHRRECGKR